MILVDTSGLLAALDSASPHHAAALATLREAGRRILSPFVAAEMDYMVARFGGEPARIRFLQDVAATSYDLQQFDAADVGMAIDLIERYADMKISLADASVVVLAGRYDVVGILTLDERHFRVLPGPGGQPFTLLPADAS